MNKFDSLTPQYLYILHRNISYRERRTYVFYGILAHELVVYSKEKASWEYLIRSLRTLHLKQDIFMGPSEQRFPVALSHQKPSNHLDWLSCVCSYLEHSPSIEQSTDKIQSCYLHNVCLFDLVFRHFNFRAKVLLLHSHIKSRALIQIGLLLPRAKVILSVLLKCKQVLLFPNCVCVHY